MVLMNRDPRHKKFDLISQVSPLTNDDVQLLTDRNCVSRIISHRDSRGVTEYWLLPVDLADELGISYRNDFQNASNDDLPDWFVTLDGWVSTLDKHRIHKDKRYKDKTRQFWSGALIKGYDDGYTAPVLVFVNSKMFKEGKLTSMGTVMSHDFGTRSHRDRLNDPRVNAFLDLFIAHGDRVTAYMESHGIYDETNAIKLSDKLLDKQWVMNKMTTKIDEKVKLVLAGRGLGDDPEAYAIGKRLDLLQSAEQVEDGKGLAVATKLLEGLENLMGMTSTPGVASGKSVTRKITRTITAERKAELVAGGTKGNAKETEEIIVTEEGTPDEYPTD